MKKSTTDKIYYKIDPSEKSTVNEKVKTTNVNILLNRVRLDKKKSFRKKSIIAIAFVSIIIAITAYFII